MGGDLRAGRARLPCGLVEGGKGASVTVVGVPSEGVAKFLVEKGAAGEVASMDVNQPRIDSSRGATARSDAARRYETMRG